MARLAQLLRGTDHDFFDLFERAGANIVRATELLDRMLASYPEAALSLAEQIRACEHEGDQVTHAIVARLNNTFVTPIDREDILELTSSLDDIVDYTDEVADYLGVYKVEAPMEHAQELAGVLLAAAREVAAAIPLIRGFKDISAHTVEAHRLENDGDRIVRDALGALFEGGVDPLVVIRWKDIFERLEHAIDSTERTALLLEGIVIKNA